MNLTQTSSVGESLSAKSQSNCLIDMLRSLFFVMPLLGAAGPYDLIALPDGKTVYFRAKTGAVLSSSNVLRQLPEGGYEVQPARADLADLNNAADVEATARFARDKQCGFAGSTCFLAPSCDGRFSLYSKAGVVQPELSLTQWSTFVRLDRSGKLAWIEQSPGCGATSSRKLWGLHDATTLKPLHAASAADYTLANHRVGRRVITEARGALTHKAGALYWWSASGAKQVQHQLPIQEAVTDEVGCIIVYVDRSQMLHRLDCNNASVDENLNIQGEAPALSDDGRYIAYKNAVGSLAVYDHVSRASVTDLINGDVQAFTIGGNRFLFASSSAVGLLRMDLWSGEVAELMPLLPSIEMVSATQAGLSISCAFICYGPIEPVWYASPGMLVQIKSRVKDLAAWRMTMAGQTSEAMQIPYSIAARQRASLTHPDYAGLKLTLDFWIQPAFACLATLHDDLQRPVMASDPAFAGESIRIYMTGLSGTQQPAFGQPNPDSGIGIVNPPALADPGASETLFFGLSPGLIGIQQLDLRVTRPFTTPTLFVSNPAAFGCSSPAVIRPDHPSPLQFFSPVASTPADPPTRYPPSQPTALRQILHKASR